MKNEQQTAMPLNRMDNSYNFGNIISTGIIFHTITDTDNKAPQGSRYNPIKITVTTDQLLHGQQVKIGLPEALSLNRNGAPRADLNRVIPLGVHDYELIEIILPEERTSFYGVVSMSLSPSKKAFIAVKELLKISFGILLIVGVISELVIKRFFSFTPGIHFLINAVLCILLAVIYLKETDDERVDKEIEAIERFERKYCK